MGRNKGKGRQNRNKMSEQEYHAEIARLKKKIEDSQVKKGKQEAKKKVKEKNNAYENKRNEIVEELQKQKEYFKAALESLKYVNANKYKSKQELKEHTDKVKHSIEKFGYSPNYNDIKKNPRRYKYMLTEHIQKLDKEQKKDNPKLKMKSVNEKYYDKSNPKAAQKYERANKLASQVNQQKKSSDRAKNARKFMKEHGEKIAGLVRDSVNENGVDWGNLVTGAGMLIPHPVVQAVSAVGNIGWNGYKGWKNKKNEEEKQRRSVEQRRREIAYQKYKAKKKAKKQGNSESLNSREMMIYQTRQLNRKHRHIKLPIPDLKWWDNMREFEKQIQLQQINKAKGIWDSQFNTRAEQIVVAKDHRAKKKEEREKNMAHSPTETEFKINQIRKIDSGMARIIEDHHARLPALGNAEFYPDLVRRHLEKNDEKYAARARKLRSYEDKNSKPIENPEQYWSAIPNFEEREEFYNARMQLPHISMLELPGFVKESNKVYDTVKNVLSTALKTTVNLGRVGIPLLLPLFANKLDKDTIDNITQALTTALGDNNVITKSVSTMLKKKQELEQQYLDNLNAEAARYQGQHTKAAEDYIMSFNPDTLDPRVAYKMEKGLTEKYNFSKNPLENLRDSEMLQEVALSSLNPAGKVSGWTPYIKNRVDGMLGGWFGVDKPEDERILEPLEKLVNHEAVSSDHKTRFETARKNVINDIYKGKKKDPNYEYDFKRDQFGIKNAFTYVLDDLTRDKMLMEKYDKQTVDNTNLIRAFGGAFLGNPLTLVDFDKKHPLFVLYEAHRDPNSPYLSILKELNIDPQEFIRRGEAISDYAFLHQLSPQDKLKLVEAHMYTNSDLFLENIDKPLAKLKLDKKIDEGVNVLKDFVGALDDVRGLRHFLREQKRIARDRELEKNDPTAKQSILNLEEAIIKSVDGSVNKNLLDKESFYDDKNNIKADKRRNKAISTFVSGVLSIGINSEEDFLNWWEYQKDRHHNPKNIHPFSIITKYDKKDIRKYGDHMLKEYYEYMKTTRKPVLTHMFNSDTNDIDLELPAGWTPEKQAMLEYKILNTRKAFKEREKVKEERDRIIKNLKGNVYPDKDIPFQQQQINGLVKKMDDLAKVAYMEKDLLVDLTKHNKNFYTLVDTFSEPELELIDTYNIPIAYKAVEFMPPQNLNNFINDSIRPKLMEHYNKKKKTYGSSPDFRNYMDYMTIDDESSLNSTGMPIPASPILRNRDDPHNEVYGYKQVRFEQIADERSKFADDGNEQNSDLD